jgi:alpha-galactosidase
MAMPRYFGDHVELSDGREDSLPRWGSAAWFGTQFNWPPGSAQRPRSDLTPDKETVWQKWVGLYNALDAFPAANISAGLYDIGFDRPEATRYANPAKCFTRYYAPQWNGRIELRGLGRVGTNTDYENGKTLGSVSVYGRRRNTRNSKSILSYGGSQRVPSSPRPSQV